MSSVRHPAEIQAIHHARPSVTVAPRPETHRDELRRRLRQLRCLLKRKSAGPPTPLASTHSHSDDDTSLTGLYAMLTLSGAIWLVAIVALCRWMLQR
jgi:hypothetical protein